MKSGLNISATRLENMRQRRMNRIRRQRAIEVGKPVDVSLKSMALNSAQQKELSNLHLQPHVNPEASECNAETRVRSSCAWNSLNRRTARGNLYRFAHPP